MQVERQGWKDGQARSDIRSRMQKTSRKNICRRDREGNEHKQLKRGPHQQRKEPEVNSITRRRSIRLNNEEIDYKKMNEGEEVINLNRKSSVVNKHLHETPYNKDDMEVTILNYEQDWYGGEGE